MLWKPVWPGLWGLTLNILKSLVFGWMASPMQWTWTSANFGRWWGTGKPSVLLSMGLKESDMTGQLNNNNKSLKKTHTQLFLYILFLVHLFCTPFCQTLWPTSLSSINSFKCSSLLCSAWTSPHCSTRKWHQAKSWGDSGILYTPFYLGITLLIVKWPKTVGSCLLFSFIIAHHYKQS